jgi:hypothetical protein
LTITLQDIRWLRLAASKAGTESIPADAAVRLVSAKLVSPQADDRPCLRITARGEIALRRLG